MLSQNSALLPHQLSPKLTGKKRDRNSVRFNQETSVHDLERHDESFDKANLWYQKKEIDCFKFQVREYILGTEASETRGLERYNLKRAVKKSMARKCIVFAASKGFRDEELANVAKHCTVSAQNQAVLVGFKDFCDVYLPSSTDVIPRSLKRPPSSQEENNDPFLQQRRVRIRTDTTNFELNVV